MGGTEAIVKESLLESFKKKKKAPGLHPKSPLHTSSIWKYIIHIVVHSTEHHYVVSDVVCAKWAELKAAKF